MSADELDESPLAGRAAESGGIEDGDAEDVPDWLSFAAFAKSVTAMRIHPMCDAEDIDVAAFAFAEVCRSKEAELQQSLEIPSFPSVARRTLSLPTRSAMSTSRPLCSTLPALPSSPPSRRELARIAQKSIIALCGMQNSIEHTSCLQRILLYLPFLQIQKLQVQLVMESTS
jgi:hypothetical protein